MKIVKVSPKGQITLPKSARDKFKTSAFAVETSEKTIILKPMTVATDLRDESADFGLLAESALDFWNDPAENVWDDFLANAPSV